MIDPADTVSANPALSYWEYPLPRGQTLASNEWVEWHVHKFLNSGFLAHALAENRRADVCTAVMLWTASYAQDPAGTLPDDDVQLARLAGYGADVGAWRRVRAAALYGWQPCHVRDGQGEARPGYLGHDVVSEIARRSVHRRNAKVAGRATARLAVMKTRVRAVMEKTGHAKLAKVPVVVDAVTRWVDENQLHITEDNIRAGLAEVAGVPQLRAVAGRRDGSETGG